MKKGIFITGTDTGVGKTIATACIGSALSKSNLSVGVMKPFASGAFEDTRFLKKSVSSKNKIDEITPFYFRHPLAPYTSLKLDRRKIDFKKLGSFYKKIYKENDITLVEGIGGAVVPITEKYDALDIAKDLELPVVVVSRLSLGTINHTLMTLNEIKKRGLKTIGVIFNTIPKKSKGLAEKTNPEIIKKLSGVEVLGTIPYISEASLKNPAKLAIFGKKHIALKKLL